MGEPIWDPNLTPPTPYCGMMLQRMSKMEERVKNMHENELVHIQNDITVVRKTVERMANRGQRPTWAVVALITFLSSACVALLVIAVK